MAQVVFDRFHVQRLVQDALDEVRRAEVRALDETGDRQALKKTRWALLKNQWNLSTVELQRLSTIQRTNRRLYRAYLLKTVLADILGRHQPGVVREKLAEWIVSARRAGVRRAGGALEVDSYGADFSHLSVAFLPGNRPHKNQAMCKPSTRGVVRPG